MYIHIHVFVPRDMITSTCMELKWYIHTYTYLHICAAWHNTSRMQCRWSIYIYIYSFTCLCCVTGYTHIHVFGVTYSHMCIHGIGWRRCIGCLKLQVSFRKKATNYRALLWKLNYKDGASDASPPPCIESEREREREREREKEKERVRQRERERERKREGGRERESDMCLTRCIYLQKHQ